MKVSNKKIIVTGGGAGIGKEIVKKLLEKKSTVIAVDINETNLQNLQKELDNSNLHTYVLDVSNEQKVGAFIEYLKKEHQDIDGIINNAGIIQPFTVVEELELDLIKKVFDVNFFGPLLLIKKLMPFLKKRNEAHILNVSSMGGFFPFPKQTIYGSSKAALKILTEGLYSELKSTNIKVTLVLPGAVNTDISKNSNIKLTSDKNSSSFGLSASKAATLIVKAMEKNKFRVFAGTDSKFMNFMYKLNSKWAINIVSKLMNKMIK